MTSLVRIENGQLITDSLIVADTFAKNHKDVLRDVRELECSEEFRQRNFAPSSYKSEQNKDLPKIDMTQDGFTFLAMGYTGKEAARFKEMYISEFNRMRHQLSDPYASLSPEVRAIFAVDTKVQKLETRIEEISEKVETQITLTQGEQRRIQKAVGSRVYDFTQDTDERSSMFRELYREIKDRWAVPSYRDLLRKDLLDVIKYIDAWFPRKVTS